MLRLILYPNGRFGQQFRPRNLFCVGSLCCLNVWYREYCLMGDVVNVSCLITVVSSVARWSATFMANIVCELTLFCLIGCKRQYYSWIKIDQLDVTCFIISLFTAQHVSNVSTSIFRSLRLIVDLFHVLYCSGSMCDGVTVWFGWGGVVSCIRMKQVDIKLVYLYSTIKMMHGPVNIRQYYLYRRHCLCVSFNF